MVNFNGGDVPQKVNHCTAFNDRYYVYSVNLAFSPFAREDTHLDVRDW